MSNSKPNIYVWDAEICNKIKYMMNGKLSKEVIHMLMNTPLEIKFREIGLGGVQLKSGKTPSIYRGLLTDEIVKTGNITIHWDDSYDLDEHSFKIWVYFHGDTRKSVVQDFNEIHSCIQNFIKVHQQSESLSVEEIPDRENLAMEGRLLCKSFMELY